MVKQSVAVIGSSVSEIAYKDSGFVLMKDFPFEFRSAGDVPAVMKGTSYYYVEDVLDGASKVKDDDHPLSLVDYLAVASSTARPIMMPSVITVCDIEGVFRFALYVALTNGRIASMIYGQGPPSMGGRKVVPMSHKHLTMFIHVIKKLLLMFGLDFDIPPHFYTVHNMIYAAGLNLRLYDEDTPEGHDLPFQSTCPAFPDNTKLRRLVQPEQLLAHWTSQINILNLSDVIKISGANIAALYDIASVTGAKNPLKGIVVDTGASIDNAAIAMIRPLALEDFPSVTEIDTHRLKRKPFVNVELGQLALESHGSEAFAPLYETFWLIANSVGRHVNSLFSSRNVVGIASPLLKQFFPKSFVTSVSIVPQKSNRFEDWQLVNDSLFFEEVHKYIDELSSITLGVADLVILDDWALDEIRTKRVFLHALVKARRLIAVGGVLILNITFPISTNLEFIEQLNFTSAHFKFFHLQRLSSVDPLLFHYQIVFNGRLECPVTSNHVGKAIYNYEHLVKYYQWLEYSAFVKVLPSDIAPKVVSIDFAGIVSKQQTSYGVAAIPSRTPVVDVEGKAVKAVPVDPTDPHFLRVRFYEKYRTFVSGDELYNNNFKAWMFQAMGVLLIPRPLEHYTSVAHGVETHWKIHLCSPPLMFSADCEADNKKSVITLAYFEFYHAMKTWDESPTSKQSPRLYCEHGHAKPGEALDKTVNYIQQQFERLRVVNDLKDAGIKIAEDIVPKVWAPSFNTTVVTSSHTATTTSTTTTRGVLAAPPGKCVATQLTTAPRTRSIELTAWQQEVLTVLEKSVVPLTAKELRRAMRTEYRDVADKADVNRFLKTIERCLQKSVIKNKNHWSMTTTASSVKIMILSGHF